MLEKQTKAEIAANKARLRGNVKRWLVFWAIVGLAVMWLAGYAMGVFDGAANCTIFESVCKESES